MATGNADNVFQKQLKDIIDRFARERDKHKHRGLFLKLATAALAALATVLLGWQDAPSVATLFKNLALVANALITLFAAYEAFFEPRKLWVRETAVLNALKDVQRDLDVELAAGDLPADRLRSYQDRMNATLQTSLDAWLKDKTTSTKP
jgi:hypothetical protein